MATAVVMLIHLWPASTMPIRLCIWQVVLYTVSMATATWLAAANHGRVSKTQPSRKLSMLTLIRSLPAGCWLQLGHSLETPSVYCLPDHTFRALWRSYWFCFYLCRLGGVIITGGGVLIALWVSSGLPIAGLRPLV